MQMIAVTLENYPSWWIIVFKEFYIFEIILRIVISYHFFLQCHLILERFFEVNEEEIKIFKKNSKAFEILKFKIKKKMNE